jgi:hypothetical protein
MNITPRFRRAIRVSAMLATLVSLQGLSACVTYERYPTRESTPPPSPPPMPEVSASGGQRTTAYLEGCQEANGAKVCTVLAPTGSSVIDLTVQSPTELVVGGARMDDSLADTARFQSATGLASSNIEPVVERLEPGFARVTVNNTDTGPLRIVIGARPLAAEDALRRDVRSLTPWARASAQGLRVLRNAAACRVVRAVYEAQGMTCAEVPWYLPNIVCWKQHLLCAHSAS